MIPNPIRIPAKINFSYCTGIDPDSNSNSSKKRNRNTSTENRFSSKTNFYTIASRLDLNTWRWSKLEPTGTRPLKSRNLASWVSGEKMFLFGGFGEGKEAGNRDVF